MGLAAAMTMNSSTLHVSHFEPTVVTYPFEQPCTDRMLSTMAYLPTNNWTIGILHFTILYVAYFMRSEV